MKEVNEKKEETETILIKKIKVLEYALEKERGNEKPEEKKEKFQLEPIKIPFSEKKLLTEEMRKYLKDLECSNVWNLISKPSNIVPEAMGINKELVLTRLGINEPKPEVKVNEEPIKEDKPIIETKEEIKKEPVKQELKEEIKEEVKESPKKEEKKEKKKSVKEKDYSKNFSAKELKEEMLKMKQLAKEGKLPGLEDETVDKRASKSFNKEELDDLNINLSKKEERPKEKEKKNREPLKYLNSLFHHLSGIRSLSWHPKEVALVSGSEDCTLKLWNIKKKEPIHTFRGHNEPVLSVICDENVIYSASADTEIRIWDIPKKSPPQVYGIAIPFEKGILKGHTDAVWSISLLKNRLLSASSDSTIKVWNLDGYSLMKSFDLESIPTCVLTLESLPNQFISTHVNSINLFDIETGKQIWKNKESLIYQAVVHNKLPIVISAHEDKFIKFWDLNSGKLIKEIVGHNDSVTSISLDPNGLVFVTGGHDSSVRMWDISTKECIQEISARHVKNDESVLTVSHHQKENYFALGGADSIIKIYQ